MRWAQQTLHASCETDTNWPWPRRAAITRDIQISYFKTVNGRLEPVSDDEADTVADRNVTAKMPPCGCSNCWLCGIVNRKSDADYGGLPINQRSALLVLVVLWLEPFKDIKAERGYGWRVTGSSMTWSVLTATRAIDEWQTSGNLWHQSHLRY